MEHLEFKASLSTNPYCKIKKIDTQIRWIDRQKDREMIERQREEKKDQQVDRRKQANPSFYQVKKKKKEQKSWPAVAMALVGS